MRDRVVIPDSIPVGVRISASGSVPGAIPTAAPTPPVMGVRSQIGTPARSTSPYSNIQPSISSAGSGVFNTTATPSLSERLSGRAVSSGTTPSVTGSYKPSSAPSPYTPLSSRLSGAAPIVPREGRVNAPVSAPSAAPTRAGSGNVRIPLPSLPNLGSRPLSRVAAPVARAIDPAVRAVRPVVQQVGSAATRAANAAAPLTNAAGRVAGVANRALPYVAGALDFAQGLESGESVGEAALEASAATAGGLYGAAQGAAYGAALLAPLGPIGIGLGAFGGGLLGGSLGWGLGGTAADRLYGLLFPNRGTPDPTQSATILPSPFYGGQSVGVSYDISKTFTYQYFWKGSDLAVGGVDTLTLTDRKPGPISAIEVVANEGGYANAGVYVSHRDGRSKMGGGTSSGSTQWEVRIISQSPPVVVRSDGLPDTGGNPAPAPGTNAITLAPATGSPAPIPTGHTGNRTPTAPTGNRDPLVPTSPTTGSPAAPAPNARPGQNANDPASPPSPGDEPTDNGGLPPWIPLVAIPAIAGGLLATPGTGIRRSATSRINPPVPAPTSTPQTPGGTGTGGSGNEPLTCRYDGLGIKGDTVSANAKLDQANLALNTANTTLTAVQTYLTTQVLGKLNTIDTKLGEQIPGGGIGKVVQTIQGFVKRTWDFLQIDRIISFLTFITVLHNAYMLSASLTQTLFSAISTWLDATGLDEFFNLVDSDDEQVDIGQVVSKLSDNFFKSIFGVETVDGMKAAWKKWNRIYQAATNMLNSIQSMVFSMVEILEVISDYTGRIGNALKKSGTVLQNAFNWMNPNSNYQDGKWFRYLNNVQEFVETLDEIGSEVVSIQDTARELSDQKDEFNKAVQDAEISVSSAETAAKTASTPNVTITAQDERRAEPQ